MNVNTEYFERLHDVAKRIVDGGSADADLAAALRTATLELASRYSDPTHALKQLYSAETELGDLLRKAVAIVTKDDDDDDDTEEFAKARNRDYVGAQGLGAAVMDHALDRLDHLRRKHGFEKTESTPMESIEKLKADRTENLLAIGKAGGAVAMAKIINADNDAHGLSEAEYTAILTQHAQKLFPDKTPDSAFAKLFADNGPDGVLLRKAHNVVKLSAFDVQPTMVGGVGATNEANDDEQSEASRQLGEMAERLRATSPWLGADQAFARVFENPANAKLAGKAHRRPSAPPGGAYPMPR
jgi:hypothetical protein